MKSVGAMNVSVATLLMMQILGCTDAKPVPELTRANRALQPIPASAYFDVLSQMEGQKKRKENQIQLLFLVSYVVRLYAFFSFFSLILF